MRECSCGSGEEKRPLVDARGIFVGYVCDACLPTKMARYRPEIFTDSCYETTEPVD